MAEFIIVNEFETGRQVLINTDELQRVSETVVDGVASTYMTYRGYSTRIKETLAAVATFLQTPWGRPYTYNPYGGLPVGGVVYSTPGQIEFGSGKA